ncbi:MAG: L,D-transpeptidase family protein [Bacteroidales bacterium]|nr:L,D-transpeptidase family protein [Bacteroidales bacterium]
MQSLYHHLPCRFLPFCCLAIALICLCACNSSILSAPTEADLSDFGEAVYALDTCQLERELAQIVESDTSNYLSDQAVRQYYARHPQLSGETIPVWFTRLGVSRDADSLLAVLRRQLPRHGLDTVAFFVPQIATDLQVVRQCAFDSLGVDINQLLPRLDYHLSKAYVRYTAGQRFGFMRPVHIFNHLEMKNGSSNYARLFDFDVEAPDYTTSITQMVADERLDYLAASQPGDEMSRILQACMDTATDATVRRTLAVNMERCRWRMKRPSADELQRVVVNLPSQQLWAIGPDSILNMRVCCGATITKTPLLSSAINVVHINPDWIIPTSIVRNEIAHHAGDSSYFARRRYYIVNRSTGDTLRASRVTSEQLMSGRLRVGQHGGAGNSLGRLVFRFPNDFAVYLHDTSNRSAFKRERRTLSHGCIRVEHPLDLALFLLPDIDEWTADRIRISIDRKPLSEEGRRYLREHASEPRPWQLIGYHNVVPHVPVYLIYYTAWPNPKSGEVEYWPDIYGYDKVMAREMQYVLER